MNIALKIDFQFTVALVVCQTSALSLSLVDCHNARKTVKIKKYLTIVVIDRAMQLNIFVNYSC